MNNDFNKKNEYSTIPILFIYYNYYFKRIYNLYT